eukprot:Hpha_TRINITY_DN12165_c0_g1::TRINITY_DN12165_c0_g1_i1::g.82045::m.82045
MRTMGYAVVVFAVLLALFGAAEAAALKRRVFIRPPVSEEESQVQALRQLCATGWQSAICKDSAMMAAVVAEHRAAQQKRHQEQLALQVEEGDAVLDQQSPADRLAAGLDKGLSSSIEANATASRLIDGEIDTPTIVAVGPAGKAAASGSGAHYFVPAATACTFLGVVLFFSLRSGSKEIALSRTGSSRRFRRRSSDDEHRPLLPT